MTAHHGVHKARLTFVIINIVNPALGAPPEVVVHRGVVLAGGDNVQVRVVDNVPNVHEYQRIQPGTN